MDKSISELVHFGNADWHPIDKWPTCEVVEGEQHDISVRMQVQERPQIADGTWTVYGAVTSSSDEKSEDELPENDFVPFAQPAEDSKDDEKSSTGNQKKG